MFRLLFVIPLAAVLGGCAMSQQQEAVTIALNKCPPLKKYTTEQLVRAAKELEQIPTETQITQMLADYSRLRDACRVAEQKLKQARKKQ